MSRPSSYRDEYAEQAEKLCLLGATDKELADFFGVCEATINNWKNEVPAFLESIKSGKQDADSKVARRLYERALGFEHPEVHISAYQGSITQTPITKIYPPDPVAAIFWLKNRQPAKWRDIKAVELTGKDGGDLVVRIAASDADL